LNLQTELSLERFYLVADGPLRDAGSSAARVKLSWRAAASKALSDGIRRSIVGQHQ
jgi:hypothetical protein